MILAHVLVLMMWAQQPTTLVACEGTHIHGEPLHCVDSQGQDVDVPSGDISYFDGIGWVAISEPVDVPAAETPAVLECTPVDIPGFNNSTCIALRPAQWRCADTSRILLTAEDGTRWCHKPQTGVQP